MAANAYGTTAATTDQRALEGKVLLRAAQKLEELATRLKRGEAVAVAEVGEALEYNQKLWLLFANDMMNPEHTLPKDIKNNIASLALFVFKRTKEVLIDTTPEKLATLIEINRNIASGLMKRQSSFSAESKPKPEQPSAAKMTDSLA